MTRWVAGLPMYNVTPQHAAAWRALLRDTFDALDKFTHQRGLSSVNVTLLDEPFGEPPGDLPALWRRADLLLSQTCGYPYQMRGLAQTTHVVATPAFDAPGCEGARYRSVLAVSARAYRAYQHGARTLAACRGLRAAVNHDDSHSGMNALRHAIAPYARNDHNNHNGQFFSSIIHTGSHAGSLRALATGMADIAAIDCVTFAYIRDARAESLRNIHRIGMTESAPGLPFIASRTVSPALLDALRDALDHACRSDSQRARLLRLRGFERLPPDAYQEIERFEREALLRQYPVLI